MAHKFWYNFKRYKGWKIGSICVGLLLITVQCNFELQPQTPTPLVGVPPPKIIGFIVIPSGPILPNTRIGIQVNFDKNGHNITNYQWIVPSDGGNIIDGQDTPLVTYQSPEIPGSYPVRVILKYGKDLSVEDVITINVTPNPTHTPTRTNTPTPTSTPTVTPSSTTSPTSTGTPTATHIPTSAATPTEMPTPTATSTPIDYPPPVLISPEDGISISGDVTFAWNWTGPVLIENQGFEIRIWRENQHFPYRAGEFASTTSKTFNLANSLGVLLGGDGTRTHLWTVAVVQLDPYETLSTEAVPRTFELEAKSPGGPPLSGELKPTFTPPP